MKTRPFVRGGILAGLLLAVSATLAAQDRGLARVRLPLGPAGEIRDLYAGSYALLVGVARYDDRAGWSTLDSIPGEIRQLEDTLRGQGFDAVHRVTDPTGADLRSAIEEFNSRYGFNRANRLFYFFAGHGYTLDNNQRGFFVPRDAPDPTRDEQGFRRVALSMQQIATYARDISVRHAMFVFDSCFSGTIFRTRDRSRVSSISPQISEPVRQFLAAGDANQPVPAKSVFTHVLIRGLNGAGDIDADGFVTGTELGNYVQREVMEYKTGQTPQIGKIREVDLDSGDIVFLPARAAATAASTAAPPRLAAENTGATRGAGEAAPPGGGLGEVQILGATSDKAVIEEVLNEYRRAYEARSVARLQQVFPSLPDPKAAATAFADARDVLVGMTPPDIRVTSETDATARVRMSQTFIPRVGSPRNMPIADVVFTLQKVGGRWLIVRMR